MGAHLPLTAWPVGAGVRCCYPCRKCTLKGVLLNCANTDLRWLRLAFGLTVGSFLWCFVWLFCFVVCLWGFCLGFCLLICLGGFCCCCCFALFLFFNTNIKLLKIEPQWQIWCFRYFNKKIFYPCWNGSCISDQPRAMFAAWLMLLIFFGLLQSWSSFMTVTDLTHLFCFISEHCKRNGATLPPCKADSSDNMKSICSVSLCTAFLSWKAPLSHRQAFHQFSSFF